MSEISFTGQFSGSGNAFGTLRDLAGRKAPRPLERCELCGAGLAAEHPHLVELGERKFSCSCEACAMLFSGHEGAKYKRMPRDASRLADFHMTDAQWDSLMIPINMAFFFTSSQTGKVAVLYPSPAGAIESLLPVDAWSDIVAENPALANLESDVEALLVNRVGHARQAAPAEYYVVPIDECYKLVGLIRLHWQGLSGGTEVWQEIGRFFTELRGKSREVREEPRA